MGNNKKIIIGMMSVLCLSSIGVAGLLYKVDPIALKQKQFTFELHSQIPTNASDYIRANAKVLENAVVNLSQVKVDEVGVYDAYAQYSDKVYPFTIQIKDTVAPIASLVQTKYEITVGTTLVAEDLVKDIQDDSTYSVYFDEENKPTEKQFNEVGTFNDVFIIVEDIYGNKSNRLRLSVVVSQEQNGPTFYGVDNKIIQIGESFDPLDGVYALDYLNRDLQGSIQVSGKVDTNQEGTYHLVYRVSDALGNVTTIDRTITVVIDDEQSQTRIQDVGDGPYLSVDKYRQLENTYNTLSKAMFTASDPYELIRQMDNYLVRYVQYVPNNILSSYTNSSYGAICNNIASDEGMARAMMYMLQKKDVECYYVTGSYQGVEHHWNIVKVGNNYYHLDVSYQKINGTEMKLYSNEDMKNLGYTFDENYYPKCTKTHSE